MAGNDILSRIQILLDADTANFEQGMRSAPAVANNAFSSISDSATKMSDVVKGAIAGISFASIATFAMDAINAGNEIKKLADLSNASTQQFQYFATGAKTAGIEIDQFADQMKDMQDRIGDFQQTGGGPLADFFTGIAPLVGVTIDQFQKLSGPDAMQLFYNSLEKVLATENDIKFYMESIISDSSKLIPLLRGGGKGFDEWGAKAELAGAIMSDSLIQQMDEAKKNLQTFDLQWQGLKTTLVNDAMPAISGVIENIDVVTNVLTIGGAFLVGTYIPTIYGSITALVEKTNTQLADIRATQLANEIAAQRAVRLVQLTEVELNNARVQAARMTGMARLAFMERTLIPLEQQHTAAIAANTVAQNANNASKSMAATIGRGLMGIIGGPVGLGLLVAGAAASYLLLRDNTDKATKSLNENGIAVADVVTKYQQLTEAQQRNQLRAESSSLVDLTEKYKDSKNELIAMTLNLYRSGEASADVAKDISALAMQYKNKEITAETLAKKINELNGVTAEGKAKVDAQTDAIKTASVEIDRQKSVVQAMIQENQKLAGSHEKVADSVGKQIIEMMRLTSEQKAYVLQVQSDTVRAKFIEDQIKKGVSRPRAEFQADAYSGAKIDLSKPNEVPRLVAEAEQQAWALDQANKAREEAEKKAQEAAKKREDAAKKHQDALKKASDDATKLREKQFQDREDIYYKYASREMKIEKDLQNEISKIQKANFSPKDTAGYIENARVRGGLEIQLYQAQLEAELNDWKSTEQEKLNQKVYINELMIQLDADMNDKQKQQAMQSLIVKSNHELAWIRLEQEQRISDAGSMLRTDLQNMEIKYDFERQQILKNSKLSEDEQKRLVALSMASEEFQKRDNLNSATAAWGGTFADLSGTGEQYRLDQERFSRYDESQALFDAQMALADSAAEREAIWQAHNDRMAKIDEKYQQDKLNLGLTSAQTELDTMTDVWGQILGEQSGLYKTMAAASKAFAVYQALMNVDTTYSNVYASVSQIPMIGAYIAPAMAAAAAATQVARAVMLKGINLTGMAHDGIDKVPADGTWLLKKNERVTTERTSAKLDKTLDEVRSGYATPGLVMNIEVLNQAKGATVETQQIDENRVRIIVRDEVNRFVPNQIADSNSKISKSMQRHTTAKRERA